MRVLVVRLSSLGDLIHAAPVLADLHAAVPGALADWVVEEAYEPLLRCIDGIDRIVPIALRRWRREYGGGGGTRGEIARCWRELRGRRYDIVLDLQGLAKSAVVARAAALAPGGRRVGLANRTDGSAYEPIARLAYAMSVAMPARIHVVERSRRLLAAALDVAMPGTAPRIDWHLPPLAEGDAGAIADPRAVWLVHGSAKPVKQLDAAFWAGLARALVQQQGRRVLLPWGSDDERERASAIALQAGLDALQAIPPRLPLDRLAAAMNAGGGAIGLDTGLTHLAATLGVPTVQLFIEDKRWRAAIDWQPRTIALQASERAPIDLASTLAAWATVSAA